MKKQSVNTIAKKLFAGSLAAAFFFLATPYTSTASVYPATQNSFVDKNNKGNVEYVGNTEDNFYFRVKYDNPNAELVMLLVLDESGETVTRIVTKEKQYNKIFQLPKDNGFSKLTFVIKAQQLNIEQSFNVNIFTRIVEDVIVSKN